MIKPQFLPAQYGSAGALGGALGLVSFIGISKLLADLPLPVAMPHFDQHMTGWLSLRLHQVAPEILPDIATRYANYLNSLPSEIPSWALTGRFDLALALSALLGLGVTWLIGRGQPAIRTVSGRVLYMNRQAHRQLKARMREETAVSGPGIKLHKRFKWNISLDRETRHFFLLGGVGGGKTQILLAMLEEALARGDKALIYDNKGDFTSCLPGPVVLLAPWDERSFAWDIAKDCSNRQDARELAARLIHEGADPMWHQAARQVLTGVLIRLQTLKPRAWSWQDLYDQACASQDDLLAIIEKTQPEARHLLETEGKTTQGILINYAASLSIVADLAAAWGNTPSQRRFSFAEWIHDPSPKSKTVILQGSGRYQELARGYIQGIIAMLSGRINSVEVGESRERRLWLFLDEVPQLGKIPGLGSILEVGRSKGIRAVLGAQALEQLQELYGQYIGRVWGSLVGTLMIVRTQSGDTANWLAKDVIGYATIEKTTVHDGKPQPSQTMQQLVMEPSDLADHLGADKHGVKAILLGLGDAFLIHWPYTTMPKCRVSGAPAAWVGDAQSPLVTEGKFEKVHLATEPAGSLHNKGHSMTHQQQAQPSQESPSTGLPRLKLRSPTDAELNEMAETGSDIKFAPEPLAEMRTGADIASGGDK